METETTSTKQLTDKQKADLLAVQAKIKAAVDKRKADKVVETSEQKEARIMQENFDLKDAQGLVTPQERNHFEARALRVKKVTHDISEAKKVRDANEAKGLIEAPVTKIDREAKEKKDLAEASELNVIEPFSVDSNNLVIQEIAGKTNEIIEYLNETAEETAEEVAETTSSVASVSSVAGA